VTGKFPLVVLGLLIIFLSLDTVPAVAQKPSKSPVRGTEQLKGIEGKVGTTYTLGKVRAWNVTLTRAEYLLRVREGNRMRVATPGSKLLVLYYTMHNPLPKEQRLNALNMPGFTAVAKDNLNYEAKTGLYDAATNAPIAFSVKPAQKVQVYSTIEVPAAGPIPKLIIQPLDGNSVVRVDLRDQVKGLPAPFMDKGDATEAAPVSQVTASLGETYPLGSFDLQLDTARFTNELPPFARIGKASRYLLLTGTMKNVTLETERMAASLLNITFTGPDGVQIKGRVYINANSGARVEPGATVPLQIVFGLPQESSGTILFDAVKSKWSVKYVFEIKKPE
jgi:hypothetical protein